MRQFIFEACDTIDAAIFSGDDFHDEANRKELIEFMERWTRELKLIEKTIKEDDNAT